MAIRDRILPEVTDEPGEWVVRSLAKRGAHVHLNATLLGAADGHVVLSTGERFDSELIVWTVGNAANGVATVPNAQHAVRQGKLLAKNIIATLRGRAPKPYVHHSLGVVATLGLGSGIFQWRGVVVKGFPAWLMHRGYHVLAVPTWERKVRVLTVWATAAFFGRDIVSLASVQHPRDAFVGAGR